MKEAFAVVVAVAISVGSGLIALLLLTEFLGMVGSSLKEISGP